VRGGDGVDLIWVRLKSDEGLPGKKRLTMRGTEKGGIRLLESSEMEEKGTAFKKR